MTVRIECNECGIRIDNEEDVYCESCFERLKDEIMSLQTVIEELTDEVEDLRSRLMEG